MAIAKALGASWQEEALAFTRSRSLIEPISVTLTADGLEIVLVEDIVSMVAIAADILPYKKAAPEGRLIRSSAKVGAGARNQRFLPLSEVRL